MAVTVYITDFVFIQVGNYGSINQLYINISPSLTPIVVESRCYCTFEVLAMNSVSYKFLFF